MYPKNGKEVKLLITGEIMVTIELNFIGAVKIQNSQVISGPDFLNPTINILKQKIGDTPTDDPDYRIAEDLVEMMGGKIVEHQPAKQPD